MSGLNWTAYRSLPTAGGDTLGNPHLEPETSRGIQLGFDYRQSRWQVKGSTYYNGLEDYIERYQLSDQVRSYRNLEESAIWVFELEISWQPAERWLHQVSYQWQRGEEKQGNWLADLNPPSVFYLVRWQGLTTGLRSELSYRQARSRFGSGEVPVDAALIWDLGLDWNWRPGWRLSLYADNVLDRRYVGSADEEAPFQPGISFGFRMEWSP